MLHESRKRPHVDDEEDFLTTKKRAMTSASGSPQPNGINYNSDEPTFDNFEHFRKEAIFRRMRHYSRENERSQVRIAELEQRKNTCEASYAAIVACWQQLIETIRFLVKPEDLPQVDINTQELFDLAKTLPNESSQELVSALEEKSDATRMLVSRFVHLNDKSPYTMFDNDRYLEVQKATTAVAALQSETMTLRSRLYESRVQCDRLMTQLAVAENRCERTRSKTVQALEARKAQSVKSEETEEVEQKPSSPSLPVTPPPHPLMNGVHDVSEIGVLQNQLEQREARIKELDEEVVSFRDQISLLETELRMREMGGNIYESPAYNDVVQFAIKLDGDLADKYKALMTLEDDLARFRVNLANHDSELISATTKQLEELQTMLQKRDTENVRLREQRDQQNAELVERRQKDVVKASSLEQLKILVEGRGERIAQLEMELNRSKALLAAHTGNKELLLTYLHGEHPLRERWTIMEDQARQTKHRLAAMEQTLLSYDEATQQAIHQQSEMSRIILESTEELNRYRALFGPNSSPEIRDLSQVLIEKEAELEKLRLLDFQRSEAEQAIYAELEKITNAWETLDQKVNSKVFELASLEERLSKSQMEKAKAENKFYAAMRGKEAMEVEKKNLLKMVEKQGKAVEKLIDMESNLNSQNDRLEKEIALLQKIVRTLENDKRQLDMLCTNLNSRVEVERNRSETWRRANKDLENVVAAKKVELRQLEDNLLKTKKEVERQAGRVKDTATTAGSSDVENLKTILKCSTCRINFRSVVLTKCMHTFCKDCIEKRIQSRLRKCPACNSPFAQSEVQQIWFQ